MEEILDHFFDLRCGRCHSFCIFFSVPSLARIEAEPRSILARQLLESLLAGGGRSFRVRVACRKPSGLYTEAGRDGLELVSGSRVRSAVTRCTVRIPGSGGALMSRTPLFAAVKQALVHASRDNFIVWPESSALKRMIGLSLLWPEQLYYRLCWIGALTPPRSNEKGQ